YASSADAKPPYPDEGFTFVNGVADSVVNSMPADWDYGAYANYVEDRLDNCYGEKLYFGNHYDRLKSIKDTYDPDGVFSFPTSIED
ncbi:hypothetical protein MPER_02741, partial [Moniliophthora perniciosa FA553]